MADTFAPVYWIRLGGKRLPDDLAQRILSVSVDEEDGKLAKVDVVFMNSDLALLDTDALRNEQALSVQWGYVGDMAMASIDGTVRKVAGFKERTVTAYGEAHAMAGKTRSKTWGHVRYSDVAKTIAGFWSLKPVVTDTKVIHTQVAQTNESDYKLLARLAEEVGYEFFVSEQELHFHPKEYGAVPELALMYYNGQDGTLLEFEPEESSLGEASEIAVAGVDPMEKVPVEARASNATADREAVGPTGGYYSISGETGAATYSPMAVNTSRRVASAASTQEEAKEKADGEFAKAESRVVSARVVTVGNRLLRPGIIVTIYGVGKLYSGNWRVCKAVHTLGPNGWTVEAKLERNTTADGSGKEESAAQVNQGKAQAPADGADAVRMPSKTVTISGESGKRVK